MALILLTYSKLPWSPCRMIFELIPRMPGSNIDSIPCIVTTAINKFNLDSFRSMIDPKSLTLSVGTGVNWDSPLNMHGTCLNHVTY